MKPLALVFLFVSILKVSFSDPAGPSLREKVPCIDNGRFYRNPNRDPAYVWSAAECSKYHLCIDGEIFNFECSTGTIHWFCCHMENIRVMMLSKYVLSSQNRTWLFVLIVFTNFETLKPYFWYLAIFDDWMRLCLFYILRNVHIFQRKDAF